MPAKIQHRTGMALKIHQQGSWINNILYNNTVLADHGLLKHFMSQHANRFIEDYHATD
jgi:hypothetical protein